jgi:hypothetical protein
MTDRECYAIPTKSLEAMPETHEWKRVTSQQHGHGLIQAAEDSATTDLQEKNNLEHPVTVTSSAGAMVKAKTRARREPWIGELGHGVNMAEKAANLEPVRVPEGFSPSPEKTGHRAPDSTPLYVYQSMGQTGCIHGHGNYQRLTAKPAHLFTRLVSSPQLTH